MLWLCRIYFEKALISAALRENENPVINLL
jgi:hypothetical protein